MVVRFQESSGPVSQILLHNCLYQRCFLMCMHSETNMPFHPPAGSEVWIVLLGGQERNSIASADETVLAN